MRIQPLRYVQSTWIYHGVAKLCRAVGSVNKKVFNAVFPRNLITGSREFKFIPTAVENHLGKVYYDDVCPKHQISQNAALSQEVNGVFKKLVDQSIRRDALKFEVRVMQDDTTVNAFCLPGGKVTITTALIKKLQENNPIESSVEGETDLLAKVGYEDRLAAVLGHEISHACAGHGRRSMQLKLISLLAFKGIASIAYTKGKAFGTAVDKTGGVINFFSQMRHGQHHEFEADKYGIKLAAKAGYKEEGAIWLQHKFLEIHGQKENGPKRNFFMRLFSRSIDLFSTHPPSIERLKANRLTVQTLQQKGLESICPGA